MKSFFIFILTWGALFAGGYWLFHDRYYPPGDIIGAAIISLFAALGIGALRKARIDRKDAALVARPEGPPRDGERVAISGKIMPTGAPLRAPFSDVECVAYDYTVTHRGNRGISDTRQTTVQDRLGIALAPCAIHSPAGDIRLLAFPSIREFPATDVDRDRARTYLESAPADDQSLGRVFLNLNESAHLFDDGTGAVRRDWIVSTHRDLTQSSFLEHILPPGADVCVIGNYSAEKNAIVTDAAGGGVRMLRGTRDDVHRDLLASRTADFLGAAFLIIVPAVVGWSGLAFNEKYLEAHGKPSVRSERREQFVAASAAGDLDSLRRLLDRGADRNSVDDDGYSALAQARNATIAAALIDAGADVNFRGHDGMTPLMLAAVEGKTDVVKLLLQHGARINEIDEKYHRSALEFAQENDHQDIVAMLKQAGARSVQR